MEKDRGGGIVTYAVAVSGGRAPSSHHGGRRHRVEKYRKHRPGPPCRGEYVVGGHTNTQTQQTHTHTHTHTLSLTHHTHNGKAAMMRDERPLIAASAARAPGPEAPPQQEDLPVSESDSEEPALPLKHEVAWLV